MPVAMSQSIGNQFKVFPDANAALAGTSRFAGMANGGLVLAKRDPDFSNQIPTTPSPWPALDVGDMWVELDKVRAPTLVVRALRSTAAYTMEDMERLRSDHPEIDVVDIESGHDVVAESPDELVRTIRSWSVRHNTDLTRAASTDEA
jgi:pimeloyl-ACP methyl ester carboxylesterase